MEQCGNTYISIHLHGHDIVVCCVSVFEGRDRLVDDMVDRGTAIGRRSNTCQRNVAPAPFLPA